MDTIAFLGRRKKMSQPLLQTILFGTPNLPTPSKTIKHYMDGAKLKSVGGNVINPKSVASRMNNLLRGHKWWRTAELAEHLKVPMATIYSAMKRNIARDTIESYAEVTHNAKIKYYRIKP